jgi:hypothetical protein
VREQEVDRGRLELQQLLVAGDRIGPRGDGAQDARVDRPVLGAAQHFQPGGHRGEAAPAVRHPAVPVVVGLDAVDAHADPDAVPAQGGHRGRVEPDPVGLQADLGPAGGRQRGVHGLGELDEPVEAVQQRLAAVQDDPDAGQPVALDVLGQPGQRVLPDLGRHRRRAVPPAAVGQFVDVAVVAGEIAALVDLEHHLAQRCGLPAGGPFPGHVEPGVRPGSGSTLRGPGLVEGHTSGVKDWKAEITPFGSSMLAITCRRDRARMSEAAELIRARGRSETSISGS